MRDDVDKARQLLEKSRLRNTSELNLAAAQVHATLAVEAAVRGAARRDARRRRNSRLPVVRFM